MTDRADLRDVIDMDINKIHRDPEPGPPDWQKDPHPFAPAPPRMSLADDYYDHHLRRTTAARAEAVDAALAISPESDKIPAHILDRRRALAEKHEPGCEFTISGHPGYPCWVPPEERRAQERRDEANPKDLIGVRKPQLDKVPAALMLHAAKAMENGAEKYGPYNWREKPVRASIYVAAALRHLLQWNDGQDTAEDSGTHHLGHAAACLAILLDAEATGNLIDDRAHGGPAASLIEDMTEQA